MRTSRLSKARVKSLQMKSLKMAPTTGRIQVRLCQEYRAKAIKRKLKNKRDSDYSGHICEDEEAKGLKKPFKYKQQRKSYFKGISGNLLNLIQSSNLEKERKEIEGGQRDFSPVTSSFVSIPDEDSDYCQAKEQEKVIKDSLAPSVDFPNKIQREPSKLKNNDPGVLNAFIVNKNVERNYDNERTPYDCHKTTASFIPSLCPNSKHLTKFDAIYHQKPPERKVSQRKAREIGDRLHKNQSRERSRETQRVGRLLTESSAEREQKQCTFQPDTSLSMKRNNQIYSKINSRSRSRGRRYDANKAINLMEQNKLLLQGYNVKDFNHTNDSKHYSKRSLDGGLLHEQLQTSTSQSLLLNYKNSIRSPGKRTFKEFYNQQMAHIEK